MAGNGQWFLRGNELGVWFLRLNGCMTMVNFVVHGQRELKSGEFDILATRFPLRREIIPPDVELDDHSAFAARDKIDVIFVETTLNDCKLNGPWAKDHRRLRYVLNALGAFPLDDNDEIARSLVRQRRFDEHPILRMRVFAFGREKDPTLSENVEQFTWAHILGFIYDRFDNHRRVKSYHDPWDSVGKALWDASDQMSQFEFIAAGIRALGIDARYAEFAH